MKDELGKKIMRGFVAFRPKTYSYLMDNGNSDKKAKGIKKCVIKRIVYDYKDCLLNNESVLKPQQRYEIEAHNVYAEEINKILLSCNDEKRLKNFDRITSYPYGASVGKVCATDLLKYLNKND